MTRTVVTKGLWLNTRLMSTQIVIPGCSIVITKLYWHLQHVLKYLNSLTGRCIWKLSIVTS